MTDGRIAGYKVFLLLRGMLCVYLGTVLILAAVWYVELVCSYKPKTVAFDFDVTSEGELSWDGPSTGFYTPAPVYKIPPMAGVI